MPSLLPCHQGIRLTKDLVNAPPNYVHPITLADTAKDISKVPPTPL